MATGSEVVHASTGLTAAPEDVGLCGTRLSRIDAWMRSYVDGGRLPSAMTLVSRKGEVVYWAWCGAADLESGRPIGADTIYRVYSMTKPVTSVAVMMLYEQGRFQLDDPISRFIPELSRPRVYVAADHEGVRTEAARSVITVRHLLTHTAGFTYSFGEPAAVAALYRRERLDFATDSGPLAEVVARLAGVPLVHHPGERWHYGVATDVLGLLVERLSGEPFDEFVTEHILTPLGMHDTAFTLATDRVERFTSLYTPEGSGGLKRVEAWNESRYARPVSTLSGGGGLLSTAGDYHRFTQMLRGLGALDGRRLLGRKTVQLMVRNHLPGDLAAMGQASFNETSFRGIGFGLGFSVTLDPAVAEVLGSAGEYAWGGMASTAFWVDPEEDMTVLFLTQLTPSSTWPIRRELRVLTYQALT